MLRRIREPFARYLRSLREERDVFGAGLTALVGLYALAALGMGVSDTVARFFMERFHLRTGFVAWAAFVPSPWMYNFENRVLISPRQLSARELLQPPPGMAYAFINHQPMRVLTFAEHRGILTDMGQPSFVYISTNYRGLCVQSAHRFEVSTTPAGMRGEASITAIGPASW